MAHSRRFRFGIQLSHASTGAEWLELARRAEDLGYSTLFVPDHFANQVAPVAALTGAAGATTSLRIGPLVLDNDYRHPVVTAKEMASLDLLSDGRLELGIGAGWMASDYEQAGIAMEPPALRVDRLEEALDVLEGLFGPGPFSYEGKHYRIAGLDGLPKPVQQPHPPILVGGGGPRLLRLAGREADIVGINPNLRAGEVSPDAVQDTIAAMTKQKVEWVR